MIQGEFMIGGPSKQDNVQFSRNILAMTIIIVSLRFIFFKAEQNIKGLFIAFAYFFAFCVSSSLCSSERSSNKSYFVPTRIGTKL